MMSKKRFSRSKAEWTPEREEDYYKMCNDLLYNMQQTIRIEERKVFIRVDDVETLLLEILKPKSMWYEIWLKLKFSE